MGGCLLELDSASREHLLTPPIRVPERVSLTGQEERRMIVLKIAFGLALTGLAAAVIAVRVTADVISVTSAEIARNLVDRLARLDVNVGRP